MKVTGKKVIVALILFSVAAGVLLQFRTVRTELVILSMRLKYWSNVALAKPLPLILSLAGAVLLVTIIVLGVFIKRRSKAVKEEPEVPAQTEITAGYETQDARERALLANLFLKLYKLQLRAPARERHQLVPLGSSGRDYIYDLQVMRDDKWKSRRMTVGQLGQASGSRSKCFYAIYDEQLFIKIPPVPITDYEAYIDSIRAEGRIVDKLAPRECIVPMVSNIMKRIHTFDDVGYSSGQELEEKYIRWLRVNSAFQEYLKVGNTFVFVMDMSKYYFLDRVISEMHDLENKVAREISGNTDIIWKFQAFEGRYGEDKLSIGNDIINVFNEYDAEIKRLLKSSGDGSSTDVYNMRQWFSAHLAGQELTKEGTKLTENIVTAINTLTVNIFNKNRKAVDSYRTMIKEYVYNIILEQNKPVMEAILTNILDLLSWLKEKGIALRDIKPENLLVVGEPKNYPRFLRSANQFRIGLIDVETAVDIGTVSEREIKQPQLAGTSYYATPSHFLPNEMIQNVFKDLRQTLHLQDWQACYTMIYRIVTGEHLLEQTAKLLPGMVETLRTSTTTGEDPLEVVKNVSKTFWNYAAYEFQMKMKEKEHVLGAVKVGLSPNTVNLLKEHFYRDKQDITLRIKAYVASKRIFKSDKDQQYLLRASCDKINQFRKRLEADSRAQQTSGSERQSTINWLEGLEQLKLQAERLAEALKLLESDHPRIPLPILLQVMFKTVLKDMYLQEWGPLSTVDLDIPEAAGTDLSYTATL
jgi:serine/threonine protein kinase